MGPTPWDRDRTLWTLPVDPLWGNTPAPYGPFFLFLDSTIEKISGQHQLWTVVGLRLLEAVAVAAIGYGVIMLARGLGRDPGEAFVLAAMNPLVLLTLIGGAHNDALMTAFLVIGLALAVQSPSGLGVVLRLARDRRQGARRDWARLRRVELGTAGSLAQATGSAFRNWRSRGCGGLGCDDAYGRVRFRVGRQSLE